jgi:thiamine-phosphate pyrophosphorylase
MMHGWLCVVTSRQRFGLSTSDLVDRIAWLAAAGIDFVQIRERDLSDRALAALVRDAVRATAGTPARVLVNDRFDVAIAANATGVHLREDSASAARIRPSLPPGFLVGCSIHEIGGARAQTACDYLLFGTVFRSSGKPADHRAAGLAMLRDVCAIAPRPVLGIGGIRAENAADVVRAGAAGVAAVESLLCVSGAADAQETVDAVRRAFDAGAGSA